MEAFSLLKNWRGAGARSTAVSVAGDTTSTKISTATASSTTTTTIVTAVSHRPSESDEENNADDGPFFDLEFTVDDGDEQVKSEDNDDIICVGENDKEKDDCTGSDESDGDNERELKFTLSSASSGDSVDPNVSLSPSDDLFFKGRLVTLSEPNCKPVSLLKTATKSTKFGVMMLKLKKSSKSNAPEKAESNESAPENPKLENKVTNEQQQSKLQGKFFTVKFKVEEVPIVSLFTRDNSSKVTNSKAQKQNIEKSVQDEGGFSKDVMHKYLKKVKPLYVRVSKRYGQKLGFSGQLSLSGAIKAGLEPPPSTTVIKSRPAEKTATESPKVIQTQRQRNVKNEKRGSIPGGLRVVRKHLGKGRSATVAAATSPPGPVVSKRRDDSLLQQQDGIQSAIMHCKRSFKASRGELGSVRDESQEKTGCESVN